MIILINRISLSTLFSFDNLVKHISTVMKSGISGLHISYFITPGSNTRDMNYSKYVTSVREILRGAVVR